MNIERGTYTNKSGEVREVIWTGQHEGKDNVQYRVVGSEPPWPTVRLKTFLDWMRL